MDNMEKVVIPFKNYESKELEYNGVKFSLYPYINIEIEQMLILGYVAQYIASKVDDDNPRWNDLIVGLTSRNIWFAEYGLKQSIIENLTNINVTQIAPEDILNIYHNIVVKNIINIYEFRNRLDETIQDVKEQLDLKKSVGSVIDGLVSKLSDALDNLQNLDVDKLTSAGKELMQEINDSPVKEIFIEAQQQKTTKKRVKKEVK